MLIQPLFVRFALNQLHVGCLSAYCDLRNHCLQYQKKKESKIGWMDVKPWPPFSPRNTHSPESCSDQCQTVATLLETLTVQRHAVTNVKQWPLS